MASTTQNISVFAAKGFQFLVRLHILTIIVNLHVSLEQTIVIITTTLTSRTFAISVSDILWAENRHPHMARGYFRHATPVAFDMKVLGISHYCRYIASYYFT